MTDAWFDNHCHLGVDAPEVVARRILRAIERNQLRVLITPESRALDFAKRVFPVGTQRLVRRFWSRSRETEAQPIR